MIFRTIFIFVIFFTLISCKKDPIQYTLEGSVTETLNNSALSGAEVKAYQLPFDGAVATNTFQLVGTDETDNLGNYQIIFEREKATEFKIVFSKSGYFNQETVLNADEVSSEDVNTFNAALDPKSWIQINITNTGTSSSTDQLKLILYAYREGCQGCATDDFNFFNGAVDTTVTYLTTAGTYFKFTYDNESGTLNTTDSIYLTPFDTLSYDINY